MPDDDSFTGTFGGEPPRQKVATKRPTEQEAAIAKYAIEPNKPVRPPKKVKDPISIGRVRLLISTGIAVCVVTGILLFTLSPARSTGKWIGEGLLVTAVLFIFALMRVLARRR